jgi:hypothetical protein
MLYDSRRLLAGEGDSRHCGRGRTGICSRGGERTRLQLRCGGGFFLPLVVVFCSYFFGYEQYPVGGGVIRQLHGPDRPFGFHGLFELEVVLGRDGRRGGQVGQHLREAPGQEEHLFLLELQRHHLVFLPGLQVEDPLTGWPYRTYSHAGGTGKVKRFAQDRLLVPPPGLACGGSRLEGPVQLTTITLGETSL